MTLNHLIEKVTKMTLSNLKLEHETFKARHKAALEMTLSDVYDVLASFSDDPTEQAICVATVKFRDPEPGPLGLSCPATFDEKVNRAVDLSTRFLRFVYKELVPEQDDPNAFMRYPWSFSAIDFPGSDMGKPRISAAPHVNVVMFIPGAQLKRFSDFSLRLPVRTSELKKLGVRKVDFVWNDDCDGDFEHSLNHLLRFTESWQPIAQRNPSELQTIFVREFCHWHVGE